MGNLRRKWLWMNCRHLHQRKGMFKLLWKKDFIQSEYVLTKPKYSERLALEKINWTFIFADSSDDAILYAYIISTQVLGEMNKNERIKESMLFCISRFLWTSKGGLTCQSCVIVFMNLVDYNFAVKKRKLYIFSWDRES